MVRAALTLVTILVLPAIVGCTARYSQAIAGRIPNVAGSEVRSSDTGFSLFSIAISEPTPAHEQVVALLGACSELVRVEVDYREIVFLIVGFPRVTVNGICVK